MTNFGFICLFIFLIFLVIVIQYFYYNNKEIALRKESEAQRGKIETVRDRMFQIIREQANVSSEYRSAFNEIYPKIIDGRYQYGGQLMKWIQEANPNFDVSLYKTVSYSIEIQRTSFTSEQNRMLDIIAQRAILIESLPACWFVKNKMAIDYVPISTSDTKKVLSSGIDDYTFSYR